MMNANARTGASMAAIQRHYDLSNDFYRLWLDTSMVYSGGLWRDDDTLDQAQARKLEHHIAAAHADRAARVLDIGCGWGALLSRLVGEHQVQQAVGLTLSKAQYEHVLAYGGPNVEVRLEPWETHEPIQPYDAIISIGAFEHFTGTEFTDSEKVEAYRRFFRKCQSMLCADGRLSLQTFAYGNTRSRADALTKASTRFLAESIFPETDPPRLANIADAIEGSFELIEMHNDRLGYAKTCKAWLDNLMAHRAEAVILVGEETYLRYERYLSYSYIGFKSGSLDLYRLTLQRLPPKRTASEG
ncbi:MAG: class I SAM-dependent methyltransferase [Salinisphaera sp.]|jgi:cyclopropane-fatty-acyl-phospholipid synthase|nr:class I SAM-dependent methyltransferase [Salinisphaera sp.]